MGKKTHVTSSFNSVPREGQGPLPDPAIFENRDLLDELPEED